MEDELRAAAERLRSVTANGLSFTYGAGNRAAAHHQFGRDQATIAYAWLAEHPSDEERAGDEEAAKEYAGKLRLAFMLSTKEREAAEAGFLAGVAHGRAGNVR